MDELHQSALQAACRQNEDLPAGLASEQPSAEQPHAEQPHAEQPHAEQASLPAPQLDLLPIGELPEEKVYDNKELLLEAVHAYGLRTGCDLVRSRLRSRGRGFQPYRWMMCCSRGGKPSDRATIRTTKSKKTNCPFAIICVALEPKKPETSKYRVTLSSVTSHRQHNHPPSEIAGLPNARRRARRDPTIAEQRRLLLGDGSKPALIEKVLREQGIYVSASDLRNKEARDKRNGLDPPRPLRLNTSTRATSQQESSPAPQPAASATSQSPASTTPQPTASATQQPAAGKKKMTPAEQLTLALQNSEEMGRQMKEMMREMKEMRQQLQQPITIQWQPHAPPPQFKQTQYVTTPQWYPNQQDGAWRGVLDLQQGAQQQPLRQDVQQRLYQQTDQGSNAWSL